MTERKDIAKATGTELAHAPEPHGITATQRLSLLREAMLNPEVMPEKATALAELMFRLEDRDARARFIDAKVAAIAEMPRIGKDGLNTHTGSRYSKWETMQPIVMPILSRHGLVLNFKTDDDGNRAVVIPILSGHGWEEEGGRVVLPHDKGKGRNDVQAVVSSLSYGKRAAAMAILNLVSGGLSEDDDGNAGGGTPMEPYATLADHERGLVDEGRQRAAEGSAAYEAWFKELSTEQRGFLSFNKADFSTRRTWHQQNKDAAADFGA